MSKDKVIIIDFKDSWREVLIIVLVIGIFALWVSVINSTEFKPVPVEPYEAKFYDCVQQCSYDSWGGDNFYEVGLDG